MLLDIGNGCRICCRGYRPGLVAVADSVRGMLLDIGNLCCLRCGNRPGPLMHMLGKGAAEDDAIIPGSLQKLWAEGGAI